MNRVEVAALAALLAGTGAYLLYTGVAYGSRPRRRRTRTFQVALDRWMTQAGLAEVSKREFAGAVGLMALIGGCGAYVLFGGLFPPLIAASGAAAFPLSGYRRRRQARIEAAAEAWPRMLEEIRLGAGSLGRAIPQALFEVGRRAPAEWRPAFVAAEREWLLSRDFERTLRMLRQELADPAVDAVCETLLIANELGGSGLDARLAELIEDRRLDLEHRKDVMARQAGVRFARRFVLLVPLGMALAGLTIGGGRAAYSSVGGQVAVAAALVAVAACWVWSGRLMQLPKRPRVFQ